MKRTAVLWILCLGIGATGWAQERRSRIDKLEERRAPQIEALNRDRTLFILPVGMLEVHGPHPPIGTDTIGVTYEAERASRRVAQALPDWTIVMMPPIPYGQSGATSWAAG